MTERYIAPFDFTIVSGGQTGADMAGLDWAIEHGIRHGGWCPKGRKAEDGVIPAKYQLREASSANYLTRTEWNVRDSDATIIFTLTDTLDGGSLRTADFAKKHARPYLHMRPGVDPAFVIRFLNRVRPNRLNVAGKRASTAPGIEDFVKATLDQVIESRPAAERTA